MAKTFSVTNPDVFKDLLANLDNASSESTLRKAAAAGATVFKNEIFRYTPRDTWDLADGLGVAYLPEDSVTGKVATYQVQFIGDTKPKGSKGKKVSRRALAGWIENGTSKRAAHPFVRPAFEAAKQRAIDASNAVLTEALKGK
jgi:hypothetical protein